MPAPLIGLTTYRMQSRLGFPVFALAEAYVQAVNHAGAAPVLIPLGLSSTDLQAILSRLDGILFTGGGDIHPRQFAAPLDDLSKDIDEDRDSLEMDLLQSAVRSRLPFLGICRGLQLVNVGLGGTLYTDILAQHDQAIKHNYYPDWPRDHLAHPVQLAETSRIAGILGQGPLLVNSLHHQGVQTLAPGLSPTAYAPDGIIEAVELQEYPFGLAVQWHPEWLQAHDPMKALFRAFVQACSSG